MGGVLRDSFPQQGRRDGQADCAVDFPAEDDPAMREVQVLDAVSLAPPCLGDYIFTDLPGRMRRVEGKLLRPLIPVQRWGLIEPERRIEAGFPVQLEADDALNFLQCQGDRRLTAQAEKLTEIPVGVLQPAGRFSDALQGGEEIKGYAWPKRFL